MFHVGGPGGRIAAAAEDFLAEESPSIVSEGYAFVRFLNSCSCYSLSAGRPPLPSFFTTPERRRCVRSTGGSPCVPGCSRSSRSPGSACRRRSPLGRPRLRAGPPSPPCSTPASVRSGSRERDLRQCLGVTLLAMSPRGQRKGAATDAPVALAALLTLTLPTAGHASVRGPVAYLADAGHAAAAATWVGGLAFTSFAITRASSDRPAAAARFLPRFSVMAFAAVALLAVTAAVNAYSSRILRSTAANPLRPRRRAEECALLALIGPDTSTGDTWRDERGIRGPPRSRTLPPDRGLELVLMAAVITATSALMDEPPPRASATASGRS